MEEYTLGIVLSESLEEVVLILKNRPDWQKGLYNFPGGKVEEGEDLFDSISREFEEECGTKIAPNKWNLIGDLSDNETYCVYVFTYKADIRIYTNEDQPVKWIEIDELPVNTVYHLPELLNHALECHGKRFDKKNS